MNERLKIKEPSKFFSESAFYEYLKRPTDLWCTEISHYKQFTALGHKSHPVFQEVIAFSYFGSLTSVSAGGGDFRFSSGHYNLCPRMFPVSSSPLSYNL